MSLYNHSFWQNPATNKCDLKKLNRRKKSTFYKVWKHFCYINFSLSNVGFWGKHMYIPNTVQRPIMPESEWFNKKQDLFQGHSSCYSSRLLAITFYRFSPFFVATERSFLVFQFVKPRQRCLIMGQNWEHTSPKHWPPPWEHNLRCLVQQARNRGVM